MGQPPYGLDAFGDLDTVVSFSPERAQEGLYPSIDPLHSRSVLLSSEDLADDHKEIVEQVRDVLYRHSRFNLHGAFKARGMDCLYLVDEETAAATILRARRLALFMTQPFHGTEIWYGVPGQTVALADTLQGFREILEGKHNDVSEKAFTAVGTLQMALEKAKELA